MDESGIAYLMQNTVELCRIPVCEYEGNALHRFFQNGSYPFPPIGMVEKEILSASDNIGYRYDKLGNCYGFFRANGRLYILGPSRSKIPSPQDISAFAYELGVKMADMESFSSAYSRILPLPINSILHMVMSLYFTLSGNKATFDEAFPEIASSPRRKKELDPFSLIMQSHAPTYEAERAMLSFVHNGDRKGLIRWAANIPSVNQGDVSGSLSGQQRNIFTISVTLVSREAIKAGLDVDVALSLSDAYLRQAEAISSQSELYNLQFQMVEDYTKRVRLLGKRKNSPLSVRVGNYVESHCSSPIRLEEVADSLSLSVSSLCSRFKKETGSSVSSFIEKQKIEQACILLEDPERRCNEIAYYLGFSSPAHFTKSFKKIKGMSPKEYSLKQREIR